MFGKSDKFKKLIQDKEKQKKNRKKDIRVAYENIKSKKNLTKQDSLLMLICEEIIGE
jgi:hypothetical protein